MILDGFIYVILKKDGKRNEISENKMVANDFVHVMDAKR